MNTTRQTASLEQLRIELRGLWQILPGLAQPAAERRADTTKGG
jgi:hypothetical protein